MRKKLFMIIQIIVLVSYSFVYNPLVFSKSIKYINFNKHSVWNYKGELVRLKINRPILFIAPWCPHCAKQEKYLENQMINYNNFQVVILATWAQSQLSKYYHNIPKINFLVRNVSQEIRVLCLDEKYYKINYLNDKKIFYEPPHGYFDNEIKIYPTVLYSTNKNGHKIWYLKSGDIYNLSFWEDVVGYRKD